MPHALRIAIADDELYVLELLQQLLRKLGHHVVAIAEDAHSLIEQCALMQPDVVITDNFMPDMSGIDAADAIYRAHEIPVIVLSGYSDRDLVVEAEQKHVLMYLVKPINAEYLKAALARCRPQGSSAGDVEDGASALYEGSGDKDAATSRFYPSDRHSAGSHRREPRQLR